MTSQTFVSDRPIALVGLMGVGKTSLGRRLAAALSLPFVDADAEIEAAAGRSVAEVFADYGEPAFREGERRVIARLLAGPAHVLATGGGAFAQPETRDILKAGALVIWLKADLGTLAARVARKTHRPLLVGRDPLEVLTAQAQARYPHYEQAHLTIDTADAPHGAAVEAVLQALAPTRSDRMTPRRIAVALGDRAYDVVVGRGLMATAGEAVRAIAAPGRRIAVVADATVAALHAPALEASFSQAGFAVSRIEVPPGEASKSFAQLEGLCDALLALALDRGDLVAALGGGVVGDLAGFAAAIYKRGIDFVQVPTTLLAQVDSSVGGKTAIDTPRGKNLIGAFHQPRLVLADLDVLDTLPDRELRAGYAEVLKHGLLGDRAYFERLEAATPAILARDPDALSWAVARSIEIKADIVARDEREGGVRALLNLGHTFGHAIEAETGFGDGLNHGEAVGLGCALAFRISAAQGLCGGQEATRAERAIAAAGLPTTLAQAGRRLDPDALLAHMAQDKKAERGRLTLVLARGIGEAFVAKDMDAGAVRAFLETEGAT